RSARWQRSRTALRGHESFCTSARAGPRVKVGINAPAMFAPAPPSDNTRIPRVVRPLWRRSMSAAAAPEHPVTVLLVDDQAIVGEAVRRMLEPERDIRFHFCSDPSKAIPTANEVGPTVILQDLVMPEIDGLTLVKFFRANPATREIPLIVLSSKE